MLDHRWGKTALSAIRFLIVVVLVAAAALRTPVPRASAGSPGWTTTTAVVPGGTLTVDVTAPNANITASTIVNTCPITGLNTDIIVYTCDRAGPGIPAGTNLSQSWADPTGHPLAGPLSEKVTYNANGPLSAVDVFPTPCTREGSEDPYTVNWACEVTAMQTNRGQILRMFVLSTDQSLIVINVHGIERDQGQVWIAAGSCLFDFDQSTSSLGSLVLDLPVGSSTSASAPFPDATGSGGNVAGQVWGSVVDAAFNCSLPAGDRGSPVEQIPATAKVIFDASSSAAATVEFAESLSYASQPPLPTTQTIFGPNPPQLISINPTSGPAGTTVTLTGTDLTAFSLSFGGTPGSSSTIGPSRGSTVNFGTQTAIGVTCASDGTSCTATSPSTANPGDLFPVSVTNSAGTSNTLTFSTTAASVPTAMPGP